MSIFDTEKATKDMLNPNFIEAYKETQEQFWKNVPQSSDSRSYLYVFDTIDKFINTYLEEQKIRHT